MIYTKIDKFDEDSIERIHLPKPIPKELYDELFSKGILKKEQLKKNHYYYGTCRNSNIAQWNGEEFVYMRTKFGDIFPETINHLSDDNGYDLFIPLKEIESNE
jgi:hypothetical protein